jgi:Fic family protein
LEEKRTGPAKEVLHYKDAMLEGLETVKKKGFLSTNDFVHLQSVIEPKKKGIRTMEAKIVNERTGEVLYTPPTGESLLRDLLKNLEDFINNGEDGIDPLVKMAMFHYQFESIHPFKDGNGRVGRILMILYLVMTGRLKLPVLYISGYIQDHRNPYYSTLREANEKEDYKDLILYMLKAVEEQAQQTEQSILKIEELMDQVEAIIEKKMRVHSKELLNCLFSRAFLTIDYVQDYLKLSSRQTASKYLKTLAKLGFFEEEKLGRHKFFYSKEFCKLLS